MIVRVVQHGDDEVVVADDLGPAANEAILLLHGFTGDRSTWRPIADRLARRRRVIVPDLPGHGSTMLQRHPDMAETTELLGDLLGTLGVRAATPVGYSMGGRVALHFALHARVAVEALVLVGASPGLATEDERRRRRDADDALAASIERDGVDVFMRHWEALPLFATQSEAVRRELRAQRAGASGAGLAASLRRLGTGAQPWLGDRLGEIECPTLLVTGALDDKFSRIASAMATAIPDAHHTIVPGAGHAVHYERPEDFAAVLETFLDQQETHECRSNG